MAKLSPQEKDLIRVARSANSENDNLISDRIAYLIWGWGIGAITFTLAVDGVLDNIQIIINPEYYAAMRIIQSIHLK